MPDIMRLWDTSSTIAAGVVDEAGDVGELTGAVLELQHQKDDAAVPRQFAQDHIGKQPHVDMLPPDMTMLDLAALEFARMSKQGREARSRRAFNHRLFDFQDHDQGVLDGVFADHEDVLDQILADRGGELGPGRLTAMPSAMVAVAGVGGGARPFIASNIAG